MNLSCVLAFQVSFVVHWLFGLLQMLNSTFNSHKEMSEGTLWKEQKTAVLCLTSVENFGLTLVKEWWKLINEEETIIIICSWTQSLVCVHYWVNAGIICATLTMRRAIIWLGHAERDVGVNLLRLASHALLITLSICHFVTPNSDWCESVFVKSLTGSFTRGAASDRI